MIQSWFENMDWHKLLNKRVTHVKQELMSESGQLHCVFIVFLAVALESITEFYTSRSALDTPPPLFDLADEARSPFTSVLQWLSSLLHPGSPVFAFLVPGSVKSDSCN